MNSANHSLLFSVIIPNRNSPLIHQTLLSLRQQKFDLNKVEILVVGIDQPQLVVCDALVRMIMTDSFASAAKNRNVGMLAAQGDILCFTDADCIADPDWLSQIAGYFENPEVNVLGGGVNFGISTYWASADHLSWFYQFLTSSTPGTRTHLPTLNLAVRRSVIDKVGMLNEGFPGAAGEDTEWTERMVANGYELHFEPSIAVFHAPQRQNLEDLWMHSLRYGRNTTKILGQATGIYRLLPMHWFVLLFLAPVVAFVAALRVIMNRDKASVWLLPGIWISKLAWCVGASQSLRKKKQIS